MTHLIAGSAVFVAATLVAAGCIVGGAIRPTVAHPRDADVACLWQEPVDIETRDLFHGSGGTAMMPDSSMPFTFIKADTSGYSPGYDVRGRDGREWSVKLGPEAQPEGAVS